MIGLGLVVFILIDGLVSRNPQPWAAPARAALLACLFIIGLVILWRSSVRFSPGAVLIIGVLAAMVVSDAYHIVPGIGLSTWLIYAGAFAFQRMIKRNWSRDFAMAGLVLSGLVLLVALSGHQPPAGAWNYNVTGGILAVLLPSATTLSGRLRWITPGVILAGILATTSRGAIIGAAAALAFMVKPILLLAIPILGIVMAFVMRNHEAMRRLDYLRQAFELWKTSPLFGVGPGLHMPEEGIHAHNTLIGIVAQVGLVGSAIIGAMTSLAHRIHLQRWQVATLVAVAVHSLVDDPLAWWPVGIVINLSIAGE